MPDPTVEPHTAVPDSVQPDAARALELIELAHRSLVDTRTATLLVEGVGRVGAEAGGITLCERRGYPVLVCPASGRLAGVADEGCAAILTVPTSGDAGVAGTVIFLGRLSSTGTYGPDGERTALLELVPASIVVEPTVEGGPHAHVDLARYAAHCRRASCPRPDSPPDPEGVGLAAERIRVHTNRHHTAELIAAAARVAGVGAHTVAGATLASVDRAGLVLDWTDEGGGHRLVLSFTTSAPDPSALAEFVRLAVEGSR